MNDTRQMEKEDNLIAKEIKKEMAKIEDLPPPYAWDKISSQLFLAGSVSKSKKEPVPWYRSLAFAASVLFLIGIGSSIFFSQFLTPEDPLNSSYGAVEMMQFDERGRHDSSVSDLFTEDHAREEETGIAGLADDFGAESEEDVSDGLQQMPGIESPAPRIPDIMNDFLLKEIKEAAGEVSYSYFLYTRGDQEIWLVISDYNPGVFSDFPGPDGLYIPGDYPEAIYDNSSRALVRDNRGNHVMVWTLEREYYMLWPRTDNIGGRELMELRSNWPM